MWHPSFCLWITVAVESGEWVYTVPRMRHRAVSATHSDLLIEGAWILPGGSVSTYWWWCHLTALAVISCLIDFCLVTLLANSLSQAPLLCISLPFLYWLIDSPINLLQGGWQAGIWLFCLPVILQPAGWLPEVPGNSQYANHFSPLYLGMLQILYCKLWNRWQIFICMCWGARGSYYLTQ